MTGNEYGHGPQIAGPGARTVTGVLPGRSTDVVLHLLRRATFGPTPEAVAAARAVGPEHWIEEQLDPAGLADPVVDPVLAGLATLGMSTCEIRRVVPAFGWGAMVELACATLARQIWSTRQLLEVMVDFWSGHLNIPLPLESVWDCRGQFDRTVRAHALGRFSELLIASARSPAMLRHLDNDVSDRRAVNEHYGRVLLEAHTVGLAAGYHESEVRASAYLMTGRTVDADGEFVFDPDLHWTGPVRVLGFCAPDTSSDTAPDDGLSVGDRYLTYLAGHPATAARIARKLAVRFVSDDPPRGLVDRLARVYLASATEIRPVLRELFRSTEFRTAVGAKTRRPLEDLVATARVLGVRPGTGTPKAVEGLYWLAGSVGDAPLAGRGPGEHPEVATAWASTEVRLWSWNMHWAMARGCFPGLRYAEPDEFADPQIEAVGDWLDALAQRLLFQPLRPRERAALLTFLSGAAAAGGLAAAGAAAAGRSDCLPDLIPLLLDSLQHSLR